MSTVLELTLPAPAPATERMETQPSPALSALHLTPQRRIEEFMQAVAASSDSALLLDFDGTLAPFRINRFKVRPYAGVRELIEQIQGQGRTRLALVTGRPAQEAAELLGLRHTPEVWGLHGAEHLSQDGSIVKEELTASEHTALASARQAIRALHLGIPLEEKWNAVVIHWRGLSAAKAEAARELSITTLREFVLGQRMDLLQFDGGVELRAGHNKGDAVRQILAKLSPQSPVAYLGDDATDEDAFRALGNRGLTILVRKTERPSAAKIWLKPPAGLRSFLQSWVRATG